MPNTALVLMIGVAQAASAPENDLFADAVVIPPESTGGSFTDVLTLAGEEPGEPVAALPGVQGTVWYQWEPAHQGAVQITFLEWDRIQEHRISLYRGSGLASLDELATWSTRALPLPPLLVAADETLHFAVWTDRLGRPMEVTWRFDQETLLLEQPEAGVQLRGGFPALLRAVNHEPEHPYESVSFLLDGTSLGDAAGPPYEFEWTPEQQGIFELEARGTNSLGTVHTSPPVEVRVGPPNDFFADATVIPPVPGDYADQVSPVMGSVEPGEDEHNRFGAERSLWWVWTPRYSGEAIVTAKEGWTTLPVQVFTGDSLAQLVWVTEAAYDEIYGNFSDGVRFRVEAGQTYRLVTDDSKLGGSGLIDFTLRQSTLTIDQLSPEGSPRSGESVVLVVTNHEEDRPLETVEVLLDDEPQWLLDSLPFEITWVPALAEHYTFEARGTNSLGELRASFPFVLGVTPHNDDFADAEEIPSEPGRVTVAGSTVLATREPQEPEALDYSVWYAWTAPYSGEINFLVESRRGGWETVYTGASLADLVEVPEVNTARTIVAGQTYRIAMDCGWDAHGRFELTLVPPPPNDDFADSIEMTGLEGEYSGNNLSASLEPGEPLGPDDNASIWWHWTAPATGDLLTNARNSLGNTVLMGIYIGDTVDNLIEVVAPRQIASLSSTGSGSWSGVLFRALAGRTYHFRLTGPLNKRGTIGGTFKLTEKPDIPPNDFFDTAEVLDPYESTVASDNTDASPEPGEPYPPGLNTTHRTLWYAYTAPATGLLELSLEENANNHFLVLWRGSRLNELELVAAEQHWFPLQVSMAAGETLWLSVDGAYGRNGPFVLRTILFAPPVNDTFAGSVHVSGDEVVLEGQNHLATTEDGEPPLEPGANGNTVWFSWVPEHTGRTFIDFHSAFVGRVVSIFRGPALGHLEPVPLIDWNYFLAHADEVIHIRVDTLEGKTDALAIPISLEPFGDPSNDDFANAAPLEGPSAYGKSVITDATAEPGEPWHLGDHSGKSLWWTWVAPYNGEFQAYVAQSLARPLQVSIYTGSRLETLRRVAQDTPQGDLRLNGVGGERYYIAVAAEDEVEGDVLIGMNGQPNTQPLNLPGNLVANPSFETLPEYLDHWSLVPPGHTGMINELGAADGKNYIAIQSDAVLDQVLITEPGRTYRIRLATSGETGGQRSWVQVSFGGTVVGELDYTADFGPFPLWRWGTFTATADSGETLLRIHNRATATRIDGISVVWLNEPPAITRQPQGVSTFAGAAATFSVRFTGMEPLSCQWFHDAQPLSGQTAAVLLLGSVVVADAGVYTVQVSNPYGQVLSEPASLIVEAADVPWIVVQPSGDVPAMGQYVNLAVVAVGTPPLTYQWFRNGEPLPEATERRLTFPSFDSEDAGSYRVRVANGAGSVLSLPALLTPGDPVPGDGRVMLMNLWFDPEFGEVKAPVFDADGITPLGAEGYLAQLYAGPSGGIMRACGLPVTFLGGFNSGIFWPVEVAIPNVAPGETAVVQVRAWAREAGESYEEARAVGGRFGASASMEVVTGREGLGPYLTELRSFSLRAGLPEFSTGRLDVAEHPADGPVVWRLTGAPGFHYLVERSGLEFHWEPLQVLHNVTGAVEFTDPTASGAEETFYRSRIID